MDFLTDGHKFLEHLEVDIIEELQPLGDVDWQGAYFPKFGKVGNYFTKPVFDFL